MLGLLYGIGPLDAMRWVQFCHDLRVAPMGVSSPQVRNKGEPTAKGRGFTNGKQGRGDAVGQRDMLLPGPAVVVMGGDVVSLYLRSCRLPPMDFIAVIIGSLI